MGAALRAAGAEGLRHEELNAWAAAEAGARREAGMLRTEGEVAGGEVAAARGGAEEGGVSAEVVQVRVV